MEKLERVNRALLTLGVKRRATEPMTCPPPYDNLVLPPLLAGSALIMLRAGDYLADVTAGAGPGAHALVANQAMTAAELLGYPGDRLAGIRAWIDQQTAAKRPQVSCTVMAVMTVYAQAKRIGQAEAMRYGEPWPDAFRTVGWVPAADLVEESMPLLSID